MLLGHGTERATFHMRFATGKSDCVQKNKLKQSSMYIHRIYSFNSSLRRFLFVCCYKTWKSLLRFLPVYVVYGAERKTLPRQTFGRVRHTMREYTYIIYISFIDVTCRHLVYIWRLSLGYPSGTCPWDTHYQFSIKNSTLYTLSVRLTSTSGWRPQAFRGVWQCVYKYKSFIYM